MLIGELSVKTGLSRDTIRFYEKQGLIEIERKQRRKNNYKEYGEPILDRLNMIKRIKNFGFTLNETLELLTLIDLNAATCDEVSNRVDEKVIIIENKISDLLNLRKQLINSVQTCRTCCPPSSVDENCPIIFQGV